MAFSKNRRLAQIISDVNGNLSVQGITVPTQSASDNDTSAASTAFVHTHINALLDSAPDTLNTLNEIAAALNDDANFNTTVTNSIAGKLPLSGGTITGTVVFNSAPTFNTAITMGSSLNVASTIGIAGTTVIDGSRNLTNIGNLSTSGSVTLDNSVASGSFLTDATIYPLRLTNDDTTAGNAVAMTFGHGGFDFTNFIASVRTGTGNNPKGDLVFGGRPSDDASFVERMRIEAGGDVGIGKINPTARLHVKRDGTGLQTVARFENTNTNSHNLYINVDDDNNLVQLQSTGSNSGGFKFTVGNTDSLHIDSSGNVGIGQDNPNSPFEIVKNITFANADTFPQLLIRTSSGSTGNQLGLGVDEADDLAFIESIDRGNNVIPLVLQRNGGKVGIGVDDPSYALTISNTNSVKLGLSGGTNQNGIRFAAAGDGGVSSSIYYIGVGSDLMSNTDYGSILLDVTNNRPVLFDDQSTGDLSLQNGRLKINTDGMAEFNSTRNEWAMRLTSASNRGGIVFDKPGTTSIMGSVLMLSNEEFRLGTASYYHINMQQDGDTWFGHSTRYGRFDVNGNLNFEHGGVINFEAASNDYSTVYTAAGYNSQGYSTGQRYWNHLISKGGTHITINSDAPVTASENPQDDFVIWQAIQDSAEPLFRVSNTGRVIAKQNYEIGNHKTNKEEFGVNAINTVDTAISDINTSTTNTYENRPGVYWLNYNSKRFRAFIKPQWLQNRNWVLAAKFFSHMDMPSGSSLWTNDASWNGGDFDLNNGHFSKYGNVWRYFGFNRLAMQMGDRIAPIMQFSSTQTLYGAFSGGYAANGGGVTASSTDPQIANSQTYHGMENYAGPKFTDHSSTFGGTAYEDVMQSYGLNKWANAATNSTSANNQGSGDAGTASGNGVSIGHELTVEDSHPNVSGNDSLGRAGAWIGCPLDEGGYTFGGASSNAGADSGFGFGGGSGNTARTWTSGYAEWGKGSQVVNMLPGYIWLSID